MKTLKIADYDLGHLDTLLARAGVSQAGFARLSGLTPRQVNNWCRGRAALPPWAAVLAAILEERSPDALEMTVDEAQFRWHETLGVPPDAATGEIDGAVRRLAHRYAPDQGGTEAQRTRIDTAGAQARTTAENRSPAQAPPPPRL
jgi:transcriptional regulator with XRE-family HTH domain